MAARRRALTDAPDRLTADEAARIRLWCQETFPRLYPQLGPLWASCRDWHLSNGVLRASWEATFRNWIRNAHKFAQRDAVRSEPVRPKRSEPSDFAPLADVIPIGRSG